MTSEKKYKTPLRPGTYADQRGERRVNSVRIPEGYHPVLVLESDDAPDVDFHAEYVHDHDVIKAWEDRLRRRIVMPPVWCPFVGWMAVTQDLKEGVVRLESLRRLTKVEPDTHAEPVAVFREAFEKILRDFVESLPG